MNRKIGKYYYLLIVMLGAAVLWSCSESFLNQPAKGSLTPTQMASRAGAEQLLIGAYSQLAGTPGANGSYPTTYTNWVYGSVVGGETFKGSNSGDQSLINPLSAFTGDANNGYLADQWVNVYDGIGRTNNTLKILALIPEADIVATTKQRIEGEARFLRGVMHLEAYIMWGKVPYVDETVDYSLKNYKVPNSEDIMPKIIADFDAAITALHGNALTEKGRATEWTAKAYKAKAYMIAKNYAAALPIIEDVMTNGKTPGGAAFNLTTNFRSTFDAVNDNSVESVFAIQSSVNDGSGAAHANPDLVLNYPYLSSLPVGCCGFNQPSFDLANSYRVDVNGLPYLDGSFNDAGKRLADEIWMSGTHTQAEATDGGPLDPRIDWTIGRTGVPYFDWAIYNGPAWVRLLSDGGPYTPKKYVFSKDQIGVYTDGSSWTPGYNAVNQYLIRFADMILWHAECIVETGGDLTTAMNDVNRIRTRLLNPATWVRVSDDPAHSDWEAYTNPAIASHPAGDYHVGLYTSFASPEEARKAIHMERKLELALEGNRFFDLVRWDETTNANAHNNPDNLESTFAYNATLNDLAKDAFSGGTFNFKVGKHEHFAIPQVQIDLNLTDGVSALTQNAGY